MTTTNRAPYDVVRARALEVRRVASHAILAKRLEDARIARHATWEALAGATGIPRETLRRKVGKGVGEFGMGELAVLAVALNQDMGALVREAAAV